jgi:hypothetical protein
MCEIGSNLTIKHRRSGRGGYRPSASQFTGE